MNKHELQNNFHTSEIGFSTSFPSGTIDVPDEPGGYIISSGCGSGKSSSIKDLIRHKFEEGVLYAVDTVVEAVKMFVYITAVICPETSLLEDDVFLLVSPEKIDDPDLKVKVQQMFDLFKSDPSIVMRKKVLILTHIRLWTDLIDKFLIFNNLNIPAFNGDFKDLMSRTDLRRYIIIDETPCFFKPFFSMSRALLPAFLECNDGIWHLRPRVVMEEVYDKFISETDLQFFNTTTQSGKEKRDTALNLIEISYQKWLLSKTKNLYCSFFPVNLVQGNMKCHVLLYEGAGDVLFSGINSGKYKLLNTKKKYDCQVNFSEFTYNMNHKIDFKEQIKELNELVDNVCNIIQNSNDEKTLVVVKKEYGSKESGTGESTFVKYLESIIPSRGIIDDTLYSITYYGSSLCKSTNEFRDYKNIILCGGWAPSPMDLKLAYGFDTSKHDYTLYFFIQLISRIGIRNRDQGKYNVYYSSDFGKKFMEQLSLYFNHNNFLATAPRRKLSPDDLLVEKVNDLKLRKQVKDAIKKLAIHYPVLQDAIIGGTGCKIEVSLSKLSKILDRKTKEKRKYNFLITSLASINIVLEIT